MYNVSLSKHYNFELFRYFPVANLTRTRQAVIVEPLRPERFEIRTFNATSLYILSICEVCGSYQCPYCPFYSSATLPAVNWNMVLLLLSVTILVNFQSRYFTVSSKQFRIMS